MATPLSHVIVASTLGLACRRPATPARFWVLGAACSTVPDLDVIGFWMDVPYDHPFGHRGLTHSLAFGALLSTAVVSIWFREERWRPQWPRLWAFFFLATASHGVLDAMTNGGLGIAFFAPLDQARYFFPFRPIEVSPISLTGFFNERALVILANEAAWIWLPAGLAAGGLWAVRRRSG